MINKEAFEKTNQYIINTKPNDGVWCFEDENDIISWFYHLINEEIPYLESNVKRQVNLYELLRQTKKLRWVLKFFLPFYFSSDLIKKYDDMVLSIQKHYIDRCDKNWDSAIIAEIKKSNDEISKD